MVNATLRAGIDSRGAQQGATVFQRATTNMRQAARLASQAIGRLDGSAKNLGSRLSTTARSIAVLQGPLGAISGRFTALGSLISSVGFKVAAFGIALAGLSVTASKSVSAFTVFERQTVTIEQVIRTTGGAAGRTAEQIEALSREIGLSTLASTGDVREAAAQLLTFRSIAGETFDETLRLANDVAALGFTNLKGATLQLAKAIEQPAIGLTALRRSGVDFSKSLIEVIKRLSETGRRAEATNLILAGVRKQVAGVGAAQGRTLAGAFDTLSEETTFLLERWGELISDGVNLKGKLDSLTGSVRLLHRATNELQEVDLLPGGIRRFLADLGLANRGGPIPRIATTVGELRNAVDPPGSRPAPQEPTDRATASTVKLTRAFEDNARAALLQRRALDEANRKLREAEELGNAVAGSLDKAFDEFLETGRVNFKSFVDSILKDIARIAFQQAITRPACQCYWFKSWKCDGRTRGRWCLGTTI